MSPRGNRLLWCGLSVALFVMPTVSQESRETRKAKAPETRPAPARGSEEALALAKKVKDFAGGEAGMKEVRNVVFTFDGKHRIFWSLAEQKVRIESLGPPPAPEQRGQRWDVLVYDAAADESLLQAPPKPHENAPSLSGKSMWISDTFWLLAPLKVLDDGVILAVDPAVSGDEKGVKRLRLSFDKASLTPRGSYVLHVESDTGKLLRWDHYRSERSEPVSSRFERWTKVGPLTLALSHPPVDPSARNAREIELSDVAVNVEAPKDVWTTWEKILDKVK
jgi:hypothetical protein